MTEEIKQLAIKHFPEHRRQLDAGEIPKGFRRQVAAAIVGKDRATQRELVKIKSGIGGR